MSAVALQRALPYCVPAAAFAGAAAVSLFAVPAIRGDGQARVLAAAVAFDLTVVFPGLVYFLLVRAGRVPRIAVGYAAAVATIPTRHDAVLETLRLLALPAELAIVTYLVVLARRAIASMPSSDDDFATRFRSIARRMIGSRIPADILTSEITIVYHAFRWRRPAPQRGRSFTVHREAGYLALLIGLTLALVVETFALHVLLSVWSTTVAWILTASSAYALLWLVGDYRALVARPLRLTSERLFLRLGVRWEADIPLAQIVHAECLTTGGKTKARDTLIVALLGQPNLRVQLDAPVEVMGLYGWRRTVSQLWLRVDGATELCAELQNAVALRTSAVRSSPKSER